MRLLTDAVLTRLEAATSKAVGDGQAPGDTTLPYSVLYPLDDEDRDGDMIDTQRTSWFDFQVTCVGDTRVQAEWLADQLRTSMLAADLTPTGFRMYPFERVVTNVTERDDDVQPPVFYTIFIVRGFVTPT